MEILYVYIGKLPSYILETIYQARLFTSNKITLICDDLSSPFLKNLKENNVSIIPYSEVIDTSFLENVNKNMKKFCIADKLGDRKLLFIRSFERFYVLQKYMQKTNATNILFLELDILLYCNPDDLLGILSQREIAFSFAEKGFLCSGICYIKSLSILESLTSFYTNFIIDDKPQVFVSEMIALGQWYEKPENRERTWMLPGLWKDERYNAENFDNFETFGNTLFDNGGISIAIDGPDVTHRDEWIRKGKVWWGTEVKYNEYTYEWKEENGLRFLYAKESPSSENSYKIQCIHAQNKNLSYFLSKNYKTTGIKLEYESYPYIHGDRFLKLADKVLRRKSRTDYYEVKEYNQATIFYFEEIPENWDNPPILFMNTEDIAVFEPYIENCKNSFVLITHNSDENVTEKHSSLFNNPKIKHWFTQNLCISHPKLSILPIGIANPIWSHGNFQAISSIRDMNIPKQNLIYANFLIQTNQTAREHCARVLNNKGIPLHQRCNPVEYWLNLAHSQFAICPEGNGVDTHRFWESLYLRTIPIVLRNSLTEALAQEYPCILLDKWEDLGPEVLCMDPQIKSEVLFEKLSFSHFAKKIENILNTFKS